MILPKYILVGTAGILAMTLGACGATTGTKAIYAEDAGPVLAALAAGNTLHSDTGINTAIAGNRENGDFTGAAVNPAFAVTQTGQGGVDITIDGETMHFAAADQIGGAPGSLLSSAWDKDTDAYDLWVANAFAGDHHMVWVYNRTTAQNGALDQRGWAVIGTETTPGALEGKTLASYSGNVSMGGTSADFVLAADFDSSQVFGSIDNIANGNIAGSITMEAAAIQGNGFTGDLGASNGFNAITDFSGTYSGKFFGPDAEEVGGALSLYQGEELVEVGAFSGTEN